MTQEKLTETDFSRETRQKEFAVKVTFIPSKLHFLFSVID